MGNKMCMPVIKRKRPIKYNPRIKKLSFPHQIKENVVQSSKSKKSSKPTFVCDLCVEQYPLDESFNIKGCSHFYCNDCIVYYIVSKLDNNVTFIKCPEINCQGVLECEDCRPILSKAVFDRWGTALCESGIAESQKFYCPFKDCSALLIYDGPRDNYEYTVCPNCKREICVRCGVPFHNEFSCEEFQKLNKKGGSDAMLTKVAKKNKWKRCPVCKYYVEKSIGCQFVVCRCGNEFCYECGRSSLKDHACNKRIIARQHGGPRLRDYAQ